MTQNKEKNKEKAKRRPWIKWILFGLLTIVLISLTLLMILKESILETIIKEAIYAESKGRYTIRFDELDYRFRDNSVLLLDFSLQGDTARLIENRKTVYELQIDSVKLTGVKFLKLYRNKILNLSSVGISQPVIKIFKADTIHANKPHEELQEALSQGAKKLFVQTKIERFSIRQGQLEVFGYPADSSISYSINSFDVFLHDFHIGDSTKSQGKEVFFSKDVDVILRGYRKKLNEHNLQIENVRLSTSSRSIYLEGLHLAPQDSGSSKNTRLKLYIPWLKLGGFDLSAMLYDGRIDFDTILIMKPDLLISYQPGNTPVSQFSLSNIDLHKALPGGIEHFRLGQLNLKDGDVEFANFQEGKEENLKLNSLDISLSGILVDSGFSNNSIDSLIKGDLLVSSEQALYSKESAWTMKSGTFHYSLQNRRFSMHELELVNPGKNQDSLLIHIPSLKLTGASLWKFLAGDYSQLDELQLENSEVFKVLQSTQPGASTAFKLPLFSLASVNASNTKFHLAFKDSVKLIASLKGNIDLMIGQLKIDTSLQLGLQQPEFIKLNADDLLWKKLEDNSQLRAQIQFDSRAEHLLIKDMEMHRGDVQQEQKNLEMQEFLVPSIDISSFDYWELLHKKHMRIDKVSIRKPLIGFKFQRQQGRSSIRDMHRDLHSQLSGYLALIRLNQLGIDDLELMLIGEGAERDLSLARIDAIFRDVLLDTVFDHENARLLFAENFNLLVSDVHLPVGIDDTIEVDRIEFNQAQKNMHIKGLHFIPAADENLASTTGSSESIHIPDLFLNGLDFDAYYFNKDLIIDSLLMPRGYLSMQQGNPNYGQQLHTAAFPIPDIASSYRVNNILLDSLDFAYSANNTKQISAQLSSGIKGLSFDSSLVFVPFESPLPLNDFNFELKNLSIKPDTVSLLLFDSLSLDYGKQDMCAYGIIYHKKGGIAKDKMSLNIKGFCASGLDYPAFFKGDGLQLQQLNVDSCFVNMTASENDHAVAVHSNQPFEIPLHKISLEEVLLKNIDLSLETLNDNRKIHLKNITGRLRSILFDTMSIRNQKRIFFAEDVELSKPELTLVSGDSMYTYSFNEIYLSTAERKVRLGSIRIKPNYPKYEFSRKLGYQTDRMDIDFEGITIKEFDFRKMIEKQFVKAGQIRIDKTRFEAFRDKRLPFPEWHTSPMPQDLIASLDVGLDVDSLLFSKTEIVYGEMVEKSVEPGEIRFNDMHILLRNLTNDSLQIAKDPVLGMLVRGRIMNKGDLNAHLKLKMNHPSDTFAFHASLSRLDLSEFNSLSVNLFGVEIKSGEGAVDTLNIFGNKDYAIGQLYFPYRKFKIKMINRQKGNRGGIGDGILTFLANNILLKSNNRRFGRPVRVGQIFYQRDPQKSIFNYLWKGVLNGVESTLGYNTRGQKKEVKEFKEKLENNN